MDFSKLISDMSNVPNMLNTSARNSVNIEDSNNQEEMKDAAGQSVGRKDRYKNLMMVVRDQGYPMERHYYTTKDNYINCAFRISGPRGTTAEQNANARVQEGYETKPVMLYQHGLLDSAAGICMDGRDSMAFYFADLGFDVWMGNQRGNRFSKNHTFKEPSVDEDYWDFSF